MASILFAGAAGEVTGSRHLLKLPPGTLLLDCGMFQGRREESKEKTRKFLFKPAEVSAVLLSHAHIDHCGALPLLVKQGFKGPIYCTQATAELAKLLLTDSAHIQAQDARFLAKRQPGSTFRPMYDDADVEACASRFKVVTLGLAVEVLPGVQAYFHEAGHILGSTMISVRWQEQNRERSLLFSGDLGQPGAVLLKDPFSPKKPVDTLLLESTYGDREHGHGVDALSALQAMLAPVLARGGRVLIPAFAVGRTQEILILLAELIKDGRLPRVPVFVDSPLAAAATRLLEKHPELMDAEFHATWKGKNPFQLDFVDYTEDKRASQGINEVRGACIILSASGMCESGRILHHLMRVLPEKESLLLFVGFQAQGTLGRRLRDGVKVARIFGEEFDVLAQVASMDEFSAHAGHKELLAWAEGLSGVPAKTFLVHGEVSAASRLCADLRSRAWQAEVALLGREVTL